MSPRTEAQASSGAVFDTSAALRCWRAWRACSDLALPFDSYWFGLGVAVGFQEVGYFEAEVAGVGGVGQRGVVIDCAGAQKLFQFTVEVLHAIGVAIAHGIEEGLAVAFPFFHVVARAQRGLQYFDGGDAAFAVFLGKEALGNDEAKRFAEASAHRMLIGNRKNADDALNRFRGVNGVQRRENEMAGFRCFESNFDRFTVAHFAYQDDFRRLAQRGAKGERECWRVAVQFALMNGCFFVAMQKFDGIFDGENMEGLLHIHFVDYGGQRRGFAGAGWASYQDDSVLDVNDFFESGREFQVIEAGNLVGDNAHDDGATATLAENVDAKAAHARKAIGEVSRAVCIELAKRMFVFAHDVVGDGLGVGGGKAFEAFVFEFDELAADFDLRGATG